MVNKHLLKDTLDPNAIADDMITKGVFNCDELERILKSKSREERVDCLVRIFQQKGEQSRIKQQGLIVHVNIDVNINLLERSAHKFIL